MFSENRFLVQIIKEICAEEKINFKLLSLNYIIELQKGTKIKHIIANRFDLNNEASGDIACDKYATYCVLNSQNIPACKHIILFNPSTRFSYIPENGNVPLLQKLLEEYKKIVIKPNDGCQGYNVFLCENIEQAIEATDIIFQKKDSLSISPFYESNAEYRAFYLDGEIKLIYSKHKPIITGDGISSVESLISKLELPASSVTKQNLQFIDLKYIPKLGERIEISWKYNLSGGALPSIVTPNNPIYDKIKTLSLKTGLAMNAKFVTIDILDTIQNGPMVLEVNSGVSGTLFAKNIDNGYELIKSIYREAIIKMFD